MDDVSKEYELCFRCHADSIDRGAALIRRQFPETNTRLEFSTSGASFHPVETIGRNHSVPSLIEPYSESSMIFCTDCHNNDRGPDGGGDGPAGPHGSAYRPILERRLALTDYNGESPSTYAMCYKCHSRDSILGDTGFELHMIHVKTRESACTTCHDPHGVANTTHLINFNLDYVGPSHENGRLEFVDFGSQSGYCSLRCHGKDHAEEAYER